jgi:hypothetical protein
MDDINKSNSRVCMNLTSSTGTWLNGCLQPQHFFVSLEITDPESKLLTRVELTFEQAARMLLYNGDVECTLAQYRNTKGELVQEKVTPPETVHSRMKGRLKETRESVNKRIEDARRDVYDMVNGNVKGKTALKELLHNIETIQSHISSNENFVIQQAEEELTSMQENATGQIGLFLQSKGVDVQTDVLKHFLPTGAPQLAITDKAVPVTDNYEMKKREGKLIDDLTPMEAADTLGKLLRKFEIQENNLPKDEKKHPHLYCAGTAELKGKVSIRYVNYQGSHTLTIEEARDYIKFLINIKDISQFKNHWHYKEA